MMSRRTVNLGLLYTFRPAIFFKFEFLGQSRGRRMISDFWEKMEKD